ncbi:Succinate dehydrogenase cytochrome b556 subunit [Rickettsiales bacterium Ac37b]|nr:Succinate dehydrogenase cytochrome b556 subunit [Rickettsiales bacterium Ac37b]
MSNIDSIHNRRPLSPHLSVYKIQITSALSILHRFSGIVLFVGALLITWWIILGVYSAFNPTLVKWTFFSTILGKIMLCGWSFALFFHLFNGIRHLFWDAGFGFQKKQFNWSGIVVIIASILSTVLSWSIVLYN